MNGFHTLTGDEWTAVIGILMALTLIVGRGVTRGFRVSRDAWPALIWMACVWIAIIAIAALAFKHFRPDGL